MQIPMNGIVGSVVLLAMFLVVEGTGPAQNLLPEGNFDSTAANTSFDIDHGANLKAVTGWRCFNGESKARQVHFSIVKDPADGSHGLSVELMANPLAETDGRIGFDISEARLDLDPTQKLILKFKGKRTNSQACAVMVTMAGHDEAGTLIAQTAEVFDLSDDFQEFTRAVWTMPENATKFNLIFNLVTNSSMALPTNPCGMIIKAIDLEKTPPAAAAH